jgi:predicted enzyme related to lactoylglutathione lyase
MLRGFTTINFYVDDVPAAVRWYTDLLGVEPYFVRPEDGPPAYVEFRIGDYQDELGLIDSKYAPHDVSTRPAGAVMYWHVDDVQGAHEKLLSLGAKPNDPVTNRGAGWVTASVVDPFGNLIGLMHSPHYLEILG